MLLVSGANPHTNITISDSIYRDGNFGYALPLVSQQPHINVIKTASTNTITSSADVTFNVVVTNTSAVDVTLTRLYDTAFGDLNSVGTCATGGLIAIGADNWRIDFLDLNVSVPTLSEWGQYLLAFLFMISGLMYSIRRKNI